MNVLKIPKCLVADAAAVLMVTGVGSAGEALREPSPVQVPGPGVAGSRVEQLRKALGISESVRSSRPVVGEAILQTIQGEQAFGFLKLEEPETGVDHRRTLKILEGKEVAATGFITVSPSHEQAVARLLAEMVGNSLPLEIIVRKYEVRRHGLGDLCIVQPRRGTPAERKQQGLQSIRFVVGNVAVVLMLLDRPADPMRLAKGIEKLIVDSMARGAGRQRPEGGS